MFVNPDYLTPQPSIIQKSRELPTKKEAETIFWGLGERFWMQIIDGEDHQYGAMVFDEGLHGGVKEPGFFASLKSGCEFASEHLGERLTIHFYRELHRRLCAHFRGEATQTEMESDRTGIFRNNQTSSKASLKSEFSKEANEHYAIIYVYEGIVLDWIRENDPDEYKKICEKYPTSKEWLKKYRDYWKNKALQLDDYITEECKHLNINKFINIFISDDYIYLDYCCASAAEHEQIVQLLFDNFNQKLEELNRQLKISSSQEEIDLLLNDKILAIAHLYQILEWLHPFIDGQGRTDLVLLAKLLCEEGFNPLILEKPYFSSWSTLPEWKDYLLKGMELWREEKAK